MPTPTDDNNAWGRQGREDGAYPPLAHAPREPRRNEQGPGNLLPRPSGWSPRRRSYLSFHDCAAWSFPSGQASSRYGLPVFSSSASPSRSLQPFRPGQPATRVGPATGSGRRPCFASTLCWLAGMGEINCFRSKAKSMAFGHAFCFGSGSYLSSHDCAAWSRRVGPLALPSAPCLQQLRCPSSATGSGQLRCVASTLCWLTDMENTSFPKPQKESTLRVLSFCGSGSYLSFHDCAAWLRRVGP